MSFGEDPLTYHHHRPDYPDCIIRRLIDHTELKDKNRVLEVGAGSGKLTQHLLEAGMLVTCVEPCAAFAQFLRKRFGQQVEVIPTRFEQFKAGSVRYRLVACAQAFHWIDWPVGLETARTVLDTGGFLGLIWPGGPRL